MRKLPPLQNAAQFLPKFDPKLIGHMKKLLFSLFIVFSLVACDTLQELGEIVLEDPTSTGTSLSNQEVIAGLKEALTIGAEKAAELASATDGFYKNPALFIPFPEEAQKVKETALQYGFDNQVAQFEMTLNRAAEEAAKEAAPIFVNAIKSMTVADGFAILNGDDHAATNFLKDKTNEELTSKFRPKVAAAIETVNLTAYWEPIITKYNTVNFLTGGDDINPDLEAYVTERAIEGLFVHVATEEEKIRENPQARVTELLMKVFGSLD